MNIIENLKTEETTEEGIERLKKSVETRNKMGGAMYWNIMNEDVCELANQLSKRGVDQTLLSSIIGPNNFI